MLSDVYTGYFSQYKKYMRCGLLPMAVSTIVPRWYIETLHRYRILLDGLRPDYIQLVKPYKAGKLSIEEYEMIYIKQQLRKYDWSNIDMIRNICKNRPLILLCYEAPEDFCHRHIIAEYMTEVLDIPVKEYDLKQLK